MTQCNGTILQVRGNVQGVGFRPWVWRLAQELALTGDVSNDGAGVTIRLAGDARAFIHRLRRECPPLARIDDVTITAWHWSRRPADFTIRASTAGSICTGVVPDAATCPACLHEMQDPAQRRYRYPFINCTHCGPRFSIIRAMPYDRAVTSMADFTLCPACAAEYHSPDDRRFHAQPLACPECGPQLSWQAPGQPSQEKEAALQAAIAMLKSGKIVAIKGLGGFHLACDAQNEAAVQRLRLRKQRPDKPLAVMLPPAIADQLSAPVKARLNEAAAPIVVVNKRDLPLCAAIAPGLNDAGIMLAANPLQHLLMAGVAGPLVMTSGNRNGLPPALNNAQALKDLAGIADGWLLHNRDIIQRLDDSVVYASGETLRRARGLAPDALALPPGFKPVPPLLCLGADTNNTICLTHGDQAVLSQHLGTLDSEPVQRQWHQTLTSLQHVWQLRPQLIVTDAHPGYYATRQELHPDIPRKKVLHHHAHAAACLAEHRWPLGGGEVIALVLDGIGWGADGALWGGECLRVDYQHCARLGGLPPVALPGGDLAAREPWRNLLAQWQTFVPDWQKHPQAEKLEVFPWRPMARAIARGVNCPVASSAGRLFDAVAADIGCTPLRQSYQGQAACRLEALALRAGSLDHPLTLPFIDGTLDMATFWHQWLNWQAPVAARAWAFHDALAHGLAQMASYYARRDNIATIACAGGVLNNRLLRERLRVWLADYHLLLPHALPAGDGAIAYGQAVIAAATFC
ncbi:Hydrogenase maturation protein, carbamoyltransferase HypF [Izhakiella capsodis]|uniref:Carbamoyltransferase HypF n=1 Tax=Izhakiella capsodis TaxID=1367852 RepID=A0A1I4ZQS1_9GAMM|nr:carbamoyltransferase HypF [Izhakiella capsodis]SFN52624.1 Hydrogenase maturation protein, carbamoyltransferase HypF [Izhakiella capsodis]